MPYELLDAADFSRGKSESSGEQMGAVDLLARALLRGGLDIPAGDQPSLGKDQDNVHRMLQHWKELVENHSVPKNSSNATIHAESVGKRKAAQYIDAIKAAYDRESDLKKTEIVIITGDFCNHSQAQVSGMLYERIQQVARIPGVPEVEGVKEAVTRSDDLASLTVPDDDGPEVDQQNVSDPPPWLVYPLDACDANEIEVAAKGLSEAAAATEKVLDPSLGLSDVDVPHQRRRRYRAVIRQSDVLSLKPKAWVKESVIDFWMLWYVWALGTQ